ncbi:MAG TPA: Arc family DNA-binding protein [Acidobacteriota bacterium]|nr:Arc family DNA-binding protein [Acidobacteriota bacterium]HOS99638.1 Arc family DNA-binding protein [Acidobacteriota bacterium]HQF86260.1 Arc family DNA-binding protein [Acidobacteriota bacterium]HQG90497.1 Arc family DNA-binding protein [Acidobacteriota bacterium]HQK86756.1 Arc family DNA-binding protein [Acidobacteriota bacterium]
MSKNKRFLLRLDDRMYAALEKWAADDLRSVNSQIEYVLQEALRRAGRLKTAGAAPPDSDGTAPRGRSRKQT